MAVAKPCKGGYPGNLTLTDEIKRTVFSAAEALPEDLRTAITLRELEGLSYEECRNHGLSGRYGGSASSGRGSNR